MKRVFILAALLALLCGAALAQGADPVPNNPTLSEDANACYAGGSMAGKCDLDADGDGVTDAFEAELLWTCGWYVIRVEYGMIPQRDIPAWCGMGPSVNCYNNIDGYSFLYVGPPNVDGNVIFYDLADCLGPGRSGLGSPLIFANSESEALDLCSLIGPVSAIYDLPADGWNTPAGMWGCTLSSAARTPASRF